jgi:hypothetical protein
MKFICIPSGPQECSFPLVALHRSKVMALHTHRRTRTLSESATRNKESTVYALANSRTINLPDVDHIRCCVLFPAKTADPAAASPTANIDIDNNASPGDGNTSTGPGGAQLRYFTLPLRPNSQWFSSLPVREFRELVEPPRFLCESANHAEAVDSGTFCPCGRRRVSGLLSRRPARYRRRVNQHSQTQTVQTHND